MAALNGDTANVNEAGIKRVHTAQNGRAVYGESKLGCRVWCWSEARSDW